MSWTEEELGEKKMPRRNRPLGLIHYIEFKEKKNQDSQNLAL